jgi:hypothetical protein
MFPRQFFSESQTPFDPHPICDDGPNRTKLKRRTWQPSCGGRLETLTRMPVVSTVSLNCPLHIYVLEHQHHYSTALYKGIISVVRSFAGATDFRPVTLVPLPTRRRPPVSISVARAKNPA